MLEKATGQRLRTAGVLQGQVDVISVLKGAVQLDDVLVLPLAVDPALPPPLARPRAIAATASLRRPSPARSM